MMRFLVRLSLLAMLALLLRGGEEEELPPLGVVRTTNAH
jgi:hypothetical protein